MKRNFKKPLAAVLSFSLLIGCFTGFPFVANATDGSGSADNGMWSAHTNFEDKTSPFSYNWDGKQYATYYTYNDNTALLINGYDTWLQTYLPEGCVTGSQAEAMSSSMTGFAHTIGNEGYRPTQVSFRFKPIGRDSNTNLILYPLTFAGNSGKSVPFAKVLGMSMSFASASNVPNPRMNWSPSNYAGAFAPMNGKGTQEVFKSVTPNVSGTTVDASNVTFATRKFVNSADSLEANLKLIEEEIQWYTMKITYDWNDDGKQVTIRAEYSDGTTSHHYEYTVTYNPDNIADAYNFGIVGSGTATAILIDDINYYAELPGSGSENIEFITNHQAIIDQAYNFNIETDYAAKTAPEKLALKNDINKFFTDYAVLTDELQHHTKVRAAHTAVTEMNQAILNWDEEHKLFAFADFEDGKSPFTFNGKTGDTNAQFYTYNGNTALILNGGDSNRIDTALPTGVVNGEYMTTTLDHNAYTVGNVGYRPVKVSFMFKPVAMLPPTGTVKFSNCHHLMYPLTFSGKNATVPLEQVFVMDMMSQGANARISWSKDYSGLIAKGGSKVVFTGISDQIRDTQNFTFATPGTGINRDATTEEEKKANLAVIEEIPWYTMDVIYTWNDEQNQVTVQAFIGDGKVTYSNQYTVTYDKENVQDVYNFGLVCSNSTNAWIIDDFAYFSENMAKNGNHEIFGPQTEFLAKHQTVIDLADGFDVTKDYAGKTTEEKEAIESAIDAFLTDYAVLADFIKSYPEVATANENVIAMQEAILSYGEPASIKFISVQSQITDSIALIYKVSVGDLPEGSVPVMTFTMNGVTTEPVKGTPVADTTDMYTFKYSNIMAQNMADKITAALTVGDETVTYEYSVMDYCQKVLDMTAIEEYTEAELLALKRTIVDLVAYGAAVQKYRDAAIEESVLLTSMLTEDQLSYGTQDDGVLDGLDGVVTDKLTGTASEDAQWTGVTLVLKDKTNIRAKFTAQDISDLTIRIKANGVLVATLDSSDFKAIGTDVYTIDYADIYAYEYGKAFTFEFVRGGTQIGQTLNYSANTYLYAKKDSTIENLVPLLKKINNFGNAAVEFHRLFSSRAIQ